MFKYILVLVIFSLSMSAIAVSPQEKEQLDIMIAQLASVERAAVKARGLQSEGSPTKIQYESLLFDVAQIKQALERARHAKTQSPRNLPPLRLNYGNE